MAQVIARPGESFESLMRRFKRAVERSGVLSELKFRERFEKPSERRKRKEAEARKRELKRQEKEDKYFKSNQNFKFNKSHTVKIPLINNKNKTNHYSKPNQGNRNYNQNRQNTNRPNK